MTVRKHLPVLITLLLGLTISLMGCSSLTSGLTNKSTPTTAVTTSTNTTATPSDTTTTNTPIDANTNPSAVENVSQSGKTTTPTKAGVNRNTVAISKIEYNQLKYGYTYEKVKGLLGDTGEVVTESGIKGSKSYTVTYLYHVKSPSGGELFLAFKDDKLVNKMEVNLQ